MKLAPLIIERFAKWIVGGVPFESAKRIVTAAADTGLPGEVKRAIAFAQLTALGYDLAGFLINLAIELAVAWLKAKSRG